ncbi:hypothetical protein PL373_02605 [Tenacibaculum maritimum]|nr:hypothetical protein [Tenacibaculum maritimum]
MKKLILIVTIITLFTSCTESKVKDVAAFEFNNAWYWVSSYSKDATEQDVKDYANLLANPNQTSFFFAYPDSVDVSLFANEKFSYETFICLVLKYGYRLKLNLR